MNDSENSQREIESLRERLSQLSLACLCITGDPYTVLLEAAEALRTATEYALL